VKSAASVHGFAAFNRDFLARLGDKRGKIAATDVGRRREEFLRSVGAELLRNRSFDHPFLVHEADFTELCRAAQLLLSAQLKIVRQLCATLAPEDVLRTLRVPVEMAPFVDWDNLRNGGVTIARMDVIPTGGRYVFCEFNVHSAVGGSECLVGAELFCEAIGLGKANSPRSPLQDLSELYAELCRQRKLTRVVILDSVAHGKLGYPRQERLKDHLLQTDPTLTVALHDEATYPPAWLDPREGERTLIHRMFTYDEIKDGCEFLGRLKASGAYLTNGFEAEVRMSKVFLALLWDQSFHLLFTAEELHAIARYLPPAFLLTERNLHAVLEDRARHVFKSNGGYGGASVLIGSEHEASALEDRLRASGLEGWICQAYVEADALAVPEPSGGAVDHRFVLALYVYNGRSNGFLIRGSRSSCVVNLSNGSAKIGWALVVGDEGRSALAERLAAL
jgi:hypothetical protein